MRSRGACRLPTGPGGRRGGDAATLAEPHVRPRDFTGRPMNGQVHVGLDGLPPVKVVKTWEKQGAVSIRPGLVRRLIRRRRQALPARRELPCAR